MKKITVLFVSVLTIVLAISSCSKDDDNAPASIEGKWNFSKVGGVVAGHEMLADYPNQSGCSKDNINLKSDGTFFSEDYDSSNTPCEKSTEAGVYTKTSTTLSINVGGSTETIEILSLTSSELKVKDTNGMITLFTRG